MYTHYLSDNNLSNFYVFIILKKCNMIYGLVKKIDKQTRGSITPLTKMTEPSLWSTYKNKIDSRFKRQIENKYKERLEELDNCKQFYKNYENFAAYDTKKKSRSKLHGYLTDDEIRSDMSLIFEDKQECSIIKNLNICKNRNVKIEMYGEKYYGKVRKIDGNRIIVEERNGNKMKISIRSIKNRKIKISLV